MDTRYDVRVMLKSYYSVGAVLYSVALCAVIGTLWQVGRSLLPGVFEHAIAGVVVSAFVTFGVAYVVPEPDGTSDAGKLRLTLEERFTSIISTFLNFAIVVGAFCAYGTPIAA